MGSLGDAIRQIVETDIDLVALVKFSHLLGSLTPFIETNTVY